MSSSKDVMKHRQAAITRAFSSPDGRTALALLETLFAQGSQIGKDTHDTYRRIGQREVVEYIKHQIEQGTSE